MPTSTMNDMHVFFYDRESGLHEPAGLMDYLEVGLDGPDPQRWFSAGIAPEDVEHFARLGMSPTEARSWGLRPELVERFKALRFTREEAWEWAQAPVWPDHAVIWRHAGYAPAQAAELIAAWPDPAHALTWTVVVDTPSEAIDLKREGVDPARLINWANVDEATG